MGAIFSRGIWVNEFEPVRFNLCMHIIPWETTAGQNVNGSVPGLIEGPNHAHKNREIITNR